MAAGLAHYLYEGCRRYIHKCPHHPPAPRLENLCLSPPFAPKAFPALVPSPHSCSCNCLLAAPSPRPDSSCPQDCFSTPSLSSPWDKHCAPTEQQPESGKTYRSVRLIFQPGELERGLHIRMLDTVRGTSLVKNLRDCVSLGRDWNAPSLLPLPWCSVATSFAKGT